MRTTRAALLLLLLSVATLQFVLCSPSMPPPYESLPSMSRADLSQHDGTDTSKPLLLAIKGYVFDVSESQRFYGVDAPYHAFAGIDASQAAARMSLDPGHLNDDISSLDEAELKALDDVFDSVYVAKYKILARLEGSPFYAGTDEL